MPTIVKDWIREIRIAYYEWRLPRIVCPDCREYCWAKMCREIGKRSPRQVAKMERERGIFANLK